MAATQGLRQFFRRKGQWRIAVPVAEYIAGTPRADPRQPEFDLLVIAARELDPVINRHAVDDMDKLVDRFRAG